MEKITIIPFELSHATDMLQLLFESFKSKFTHIVNIPENKIRQLFIDVFYLNNQLAMDGHFIALSKENIVGVILLKYNRQKHFKQTKFPVLSLSDLFSKYGILTTLRFIFALNLLSSNKIVENECYIEHISVSKDFRGLGIGSKLLAYGENFAKNLAHIENFSLHVAKSNISAFKLYERLGFINRDIKAKKSVFLNSLVGEDCFYYMNKNIKLK